MRYVAVVTRLYYPSQFQWAPTLTSHNPNPPITIDHPPSAGTNPFLYIGFGFGRMIGA